MRTLLLIISLILTTLAFAQARFINLSTTKPEIKELYIGVDNHLSIEKGNKSPKKIRVSVSHGEVSKREDGIYWVRITKETPDTLNYYEDGKLVLSEVFAVKKIPNSIARLARVMDTVLTVGHILANSFLSVIIPGSSYKHNHQIMSFSSTFINANSDTNMTISQSGYLLSDAQLKEIRRLKPGDRIYFDYLRVVGPDSRITSLPPFTAIIK